MLWDIHSTCRLCHAVYGFIFIEHLRVVLFFHLDICQKFAHIGIPECKHIGIIRSGHHFSEPMLSVARKLSFFLSSGLVMESYVAFGSYIFPSLSLTLQDGTLPFMTCSRDSTCFCSFFPDRQTNPEVPGLLLPVRNVCTSPRRTAPVCADPQL